MARACSLIRSRVASATSGLSRSASDTVAVDTESASAIVDSLIFWPSAAFPRVDLNCLNRSLCHPSPGVSKLFCQRLVFAVGRRAAPQPQPVLAMHDIEAARHD